MDGYADFLKSKKKIDLPTGHEPKGPLNKSLFDWQSDIVRWATRRGRASIFADCGLGKTLMQLEWAMLVHEHTSRPVLILAPLAVSHQTRREGEKFGITSKVCRSQRDVGNGINIANYEMLHHFDPSAFSGVVLDESSILKSYSGKTRNAIISSFASTPYRLACTATPAPNDYMEIGNHAEFMGSMTRTEMLAMFFTHDGGDTSKWRIKGHAQDEFWRWMCSWSVMVRKPSDLGYDDNGFILPPLNIIEKKIDVDTPTEGMLFALEAQTMDERRKARRSTIGDRVSVAAELANGTDDQWLVWCDLNAESAALTKQISGAVEVKGSDSNDHKESAILGFLDGKHRVLVTKPSIAGHGLNLQQCHNMAFVGLSDSYEQYYQAVRRCWRFGQESEVNAYIITASTEGAVVRNIKRKEAAAMDMADNMCKHMAHISSHEIRGMTATVSNYETDRATGNGYTMILGDSVEELKKIPESSIGMSIFSPPYMSLYTYSAMDRDLGNCTNDKVFWEHFRFIIAELYRVTMPGRVVAVDCMNVPAMKERDGYIGLKDFRGDIIRNFQAAGFIFHSEHCIRKDPLIEATRTKAIGLMHKQLCKDSAMCRAGIPQYMLAFRKPGVNAIPIRHQNGVDYFIGADPPTVGVMSHERWRRYADPIWNDIDFTRTLNARAARENEDERHICPMALDIIERAMWLWSAKGDTVLSPFAGVGSEGYVALTTGRNFIGIELKRSYWEQAVKNLDSVSAPQQQTLFA